MRQLSYRELLTSAAFVHVAQDFAGSGSLERIHDWPCTSEFAKAEFLDGRAARTTLELQRALGTPMVNSLDWEQRSRSFLNER
jgi:hypothetical protein